MEKSGTSIVVFVAPAPGCPAPRSCNYWQTSLLLAVPAIMTCRVAYFARVRVQNKNNPEGLEGVERRWVQVFPMVRARAFCLI